MSDEALPATPYVRRQDRTLLLVLLLVAASVGVHLMAFEGLSAWARSQSVESTLNRPIELVMVEIEPPKPPPPPEEPKPEPAKPPPIKVARREPPPKVEEPPPPPPNEPPPETPPQTVPL